MCSESDRKICIEAVKQDWRMLEFVEEPTEEICMLAINQDGTALKYIENQTEELCLRAVEKWCSFGVCKRTNRRNMYRSS